MYTEHRRGPYAKWYCKCSKLGAVTRQAEHRRLLSLASVPSSSPALTAASSGATLPEQCSH